MAAAVVACCLLAPSADASITLTSGGSTVELNPTTQAGVFSWEVNGVEHLFQQWFWYRIGNTGGEASIDTLNLTSQSVTVLPTLPTLSIAMLGYADQAGRFTIQITYTLSGSDLNEQILITNTSGSPLDFHFFQYSDFELNASANDDRAAFVTASTVQQADGFLVLSETVVTPAPNHREINLYPNTLSSLNDGSPTTLSDTPLLLAIGPGDVTWAFQWDFLLGAGGSFLIQKDKLLSPDIPRIPELEVPEPAALAVWSSWLGIVGLIGLRRRARVAA